jgi:uncharacterized membrane protein YoaK (UPF0700 family)
MTNRASTLREGVLMLLTFSSGAVDAISFLAFGKVFTAFMTGNLVFLGIGAAGAFKPSHPNIPRVCVVLVAFCVGVFLAARITKRLKASRRPSQALSLSLGAVLLMQLVFLAGWIAAAGDPGSGSATALAAIEAIAMGIQSSAVGALDVKGVFTTAATATLINLSREAADRRVSDTDPKRMARILASLVCGALLGGLLLRYAPTSAAVVSPIATALAIAGCVAAERRSVRRTPASSADNVEPLTQSPATEAA